MWSPRKRKDIQTRRRECDRLLGASTKHDLLTKKLLHDITLYNKERGPFIKDNLEIKIDLELIDLERKLQVPIL